MNPVINIGTGKSRQLDFCHLLFGYWIFFIKGDWLRGRALPSHGRGRWFETSIAHHVFHPVAEGAGVKNLVLFLLQIQLCHPAAMDITVCDSSYFTLNHIHMKTGSRMNQFGRQDKT